MHFQGVGFKSDKQLLCNKLNTSQSDNAKKIACLKLPQVLHKHTLRKVMTQLPLTAKSVNNIEAIKVLNFVANMCL